MLSDCDIGVVLLVGIPVIILNKTVRQWSNGGSNGQNVMIWRDPGQGGDWRYFIDIVGQKGTGGV